MNHTVSGQPWQTGADAGEVVNFETGEGVPAWAFRIEGRLLEVCFIACMRFTTSLTVVVATQPAKSRQGGATQILDIHQTNDSRT